MINYSPPSKTQLSQAIAQTLSMPFAYNSPVVALDFDIDKSGTINGRFKDANRPRVFEFQIDGEFVNFKLFTGVRVDSIDPVVPPPLEMDGEEVDESELIY